MTAIFRDENETWEIDFTAAIFARDDLNKVFSQVSGSVFSDVDFVVVDEERIIFVECKNSNFKGVINPEAFKPLEDKRIKVMVHKYCYSFIYIRSLLGNINKKKIYIYLVETNNGDSVLRKEIRNRLKKMLPFVIQERENLKESIIDEVQVYSLEEWNENFKEFPATRLKELLKEN